jgi:LmbE family N-acetylglucosaminyl deacetylase
MPTVFCAFAHPDDESFGIAATLARAVHDGARVVLVTATPGDAGFLPDEARAAGFSTGEVRTAELGCAAQAIGIHRVELLGYQDGELDQVDQRELTERLRSIAEEEQPDIWITFGPNGITGHPDHKAISKTATRLFYEFERRGVAKRLFFPALDADRAVEMKLTGVEATPNVAVPVGPYLAQKQAAMACHASQPDAAEELRRIRETPPEVETLYRSYPALDLTERLEHIL